MTPNRPEKPLQSADSSRVSAFRHPVLNKSDNSPPREPKAEKQKSRVGRPPPRP